MTGPDVCIPVAGKKHSVEWLAAQVREAGKRIDGRVTRTDLIRIPWLDGPGREVWAKLECRQRTGSFKARGAFNALLALDRPDEEVVTASAGNHGLAVATAAAELDIPCSVFVPIGVSELKLQRLAFTGARIELVGRDLFDAMLAARRETQNRRGAYVSAYADWNVIAGQGTIALELLEQADVSFDQILVPLGGGGLLSGVGSAIRQAAWDTEIVAVHPQAFARQMTSGALSRELKRPVFPTIADGLAVQVGEGEDHILPLVDAMIDLTAEVSEEAIQTAIYAMLHNEGLLVEGAGAVGAAALLDDPEALNLRGRVLMLLTGGNIATSHLSQAMAVGTGDNRLRRLLGIRGNRISLERDVTPVRRELDVVDEAAAGVESQSLGVSVRRPPDGIDTAPLRIWGDVLDAAKNLLDQVPADLERHRRYLEHQRLRCDQSVHHAIASQLQLASSLAQDCEAVRAGPVGHLRQRVRVLLQAVSSLRTVLEWCSAASDQSVEVNFFEPRDQRSPNVNYSRYGSAGLRDLEMRLLDVLGFDTAAVGLCATSSGMAAHQLIETFLLRDVLKAGDCVLYAPYVYFESYEHVSALSQVRHVETDTFEVEGLFAAVERENARVVYLDPLANVPPLPSIDLRLLAEATSRGNWRDRWLVIDGTMVSGGINPFEWFAGEDQPNVLYYESASKYLQLGTDFQMAGIVAAVRSFVPRLHRHRRNSGSVLYEPAVERFPRYGRDAYLERMRLLTRNAELLVDTLEGAFAPAPPPFELGFAREWRSLGWQHAGGVVSLRFLDRGLNNRDSLEALMELLLRRCRDEDLPLVKGVSFGFATTRVSASAAMAESVDPFLRFAVGEETEDEMSRLAAAIAGELEGFLTAWQVPAA
jgi:threonine dehydratase/cystathionine beta-lyase/cystathionine gamma-synthase